MDCVGKFSKTPFLVNPVDSFDYLSTTLTSAHVLGYAVTRSIFLGTSNRDKIYDRTTEAVLLKLKIQDNSPKRKQYKKKVKLLFEKYLLLKQSQKRNNQGDLLKRSQFSADLKKAFSGPTSVETPQNLLLLPPKRQRVTNSGIESLVIKEKRATLKRSSCEAIEVSSPQSPVLTPLLLKRRRLSFARTCSSFRPETREAQRLDPSYNAPGRVYQKEETAKPKIDLLSSQRVSQLTARMGLSNCEVFELLATYEKEQYQRSPEEIVGSVSTTRRRREVCFAETSKQSDDDFIASLLLEGPEAKGQVKFDGKKFRAAPELTAMENRIAVLFSSERTGEKLLGFPVAMSSKAKDEAVAIFKVTPPEVIERTYGLVSDTPKTNTGEKGGVIVHLEELFGKELLYEGCRRHIAETVAKQPGIEVYGATTGPENQTFNNFRESWEADDFDRSVSHVKKLDDPRLKPGGILYQLKQEMIDFYIRVLDSPMKNADVRNATFLALLLLGGPEMAPAGAQLPKLGPTIASRWLNTVSYTEIITLLREQIFSFDPEEMQRIVSLSMFYSLVYLPYYIQSIFPASAPRLDLELIQRIEWWRQIDENIAEAAFQGLARNLWYLGQEHIPLVLWDKEVSDETKAAVAGLILAMPQPSEGQRSRRYKPDYRLEGKRRVVVESFKEDTLDDFVGPSSHRFFQITGISERFLQLPVAEWPNNKEWLAGRTLVKNMLVANDGCERKIAALGKYHDYFTKDEIKRHHLMKTIDSNIETRPKMGGKRSLFGLVSK